jgi:hypothetical protein
VTRIFDFTLSGVLVILAAVVHRMAVELFAPESPLHKLASDGTAIMKGAERADLWFEILAIWVPLAVVFFAGMYLLIREYRRQISTAARGRP